jgi:hypothetical protein
LAQAYSDCRCRSLAPAFPLSFTFTLFAQLGIVYAVTELLQRAQVDAEAKTAELDLYELLSYQSSAAGDNERTGSTGDASSGSIPSLSTATEVTAAAVPDEEVKAASPSLHTFSELYLPHFSLRVFFEVAVILHFVSISSTYSIGAPQAFREVFPALKVISQSQMTLAFTVLVAIASLFFADAILVPLTVATFAKGALLSVLVVIVLGVGSSIGVHPSTDWSLDAGLEPYLMGTLALSGVINLMPKLWTISLLSTGRPAAEALDKEFVGAFRFAVNAAVVLCYVLNVMWCTGVLWCVPQTSTPNAAVTSSPGAARAVSLFARSGFALPFAARHTASVPPSDSLMSANANGEISTIPLVAALKARRHGSSPLVLSLVNVFVFISISVSMCVMAIGMIHLLDSLADSVVTKLLLKGKLPGSRSGPGRASRRVRRVARLGLSGLAFVIIAWISSTNPKSLLKIMAGITSLCLNAEGGLLIIVMLITSRVHRVDNVDNIPDPLSRGATAVLIVYVFVFYSFAVVVDIVKYLPTVFS